MSLFINLYKTCDPCCEAIILIFGGYPLGGDKAAVDHADQTRRCFQLSFQNSNLVCLT